MTDNESHPARYGAAVWPGEMNGRMSEGKLPSLQPVEQYYTKRLIDHGATPQGVDWNGTDSQHLRFRQLVRLIDPERPFTINDLGCGYGALFDFVDGMERLTEYCGIDVSEAMVAEAKRVHEGRQKCLFEVGSTFRRASDYTVASGIFNVRLETPDEVWWNHLTDTLRHMADVSRRGFSFNCLTRYSDADRMRAYLYYADPCRIFDFCKRQFSRNVALLHDYDLYEFTILVRKEGMFQR